jgi:hypothetical protein
VEDVTVTQPSALYTYLVEMQGVQNSWLRNVEVENVDWRAVWLLYGLQNEIRECSFHHSKNGYGRSHGYGIFVDMLSTANLVENNVFTTIDGGGIMTGGGASGNVLAYNLIADPRFDDAWWATASPSLNHNPHPMMNLWEGDRGDKFEADFIHGSSSHNTVFRSYARGWSNDSATSANAAIALAKKNTYYNVVGCVLGTAGKSNRYEVASGQTWNNEDRAIWLLGVTCEVEGPEVLPTLLRHGNFDYVTNSVTWDSTITDHAVPASLFRQNAPYFWEKTPWPAIGPDVAGHYNKIPAERWLDQLTSSKATTPPVATSAAVYTHINTPAPVKLAGTDAEGDCLRYFIVNDGKPSHGALFWTGEGLLYRPADGFTGADSFSFVASDGRSFSAGAGVSIAVSASAALPRTGRSERKSLVLVISGIPVTVKIPELSDDAQLSLYSAHGERIGRGRKIGARRTVPYPHKIPGGLYIVKIQSGNRTALTPFILAR